MRQAGRLVQAGDGQAVVGKPLCIPGQRAVVMVVATEGFDPPRLMVEVAGDFR